MQGLDGGPIRIRVGIHTGEPSLDPPKYVGIDVHRAARIMATAHGGQVVLSPTTVALLGADATELHDLGEYRLKDLSAPVRLHQLQLPGQPDAFPPLKTLYRSNLPVPTTPFRGRARELEDVVTLLACGDVGLVTLTGPGGTGKTRLALQAAAEAAEHFPDGITWVPLAPLRDPSRALQSMADALGVKADPGLTLLETLGSGLAGRRPLLVVDNAEHLLPALADAVAAFRVAVPTATLIVTSRERLQLDGEQVYPVPSLAGHEGVDLFLERARTLGSDLAETAAVSQLCARLDQLPLALELAAARTPLFGPEQLLARLDNRLDLLKGGRDADPRQQTLRATIAWSHDLLDEPEQRLFRRLAVFVGGATYDAAEQIAGASPDTLQSLLDKSLVRRTESPEEPRYWMLETIREFAAEQLVRAGERDSLEQRHFDVYCRVARDARAVLMSPEQRRSLATLDAEAANWRAALRHGLDGHDPNEAGSMAADLARYWWFRGQADEGLPLLQTLLERDALRPAVRARVLSGAADLASQLDQREPERRFLEEAIGLFEELGDFDGLAQTYGSSVWWASRQGDAQSASRFADLAVAAAEQIETPWVRCYAWTSAAEAAGARGAWDEAKRLARVGIEFARESGDPRSMVMALGNLGWCEIAMENYAAAREALTEALAAGDPDDREFVAIMESNRGLTESLLDQPATAADHFLTSLGSVPPGSRLAIAEPMFGVAGLAADSHPSTAVQLWAASVALHESCGAPLGPVLERIEAAVLAPLRSRLARVEFDRLWDVGQLLPLPAALDLAVAEAESIAAARPRA
jgi:predicted ATPase